MSLCLSLDLLLTVRAMVRFPLGPSSMLELVLIFALRSIYVTLSVLGPRAWRAVVVLPCRQGFETPVFTSGTYSIQRTGEWCVLGITSIHSPNPYLLPRDATPESDAFWWSLIDAVGSQTGVWSFGFLV